MLVPVVIFVVTRLVDAVFLVMGAHDQSALPATSPAYHVSFPTEGSPGYWGVLSNWDGQWYRSIAESGYPGSLPTEGGEVVPNEWAFYPGYPMLVRLVMMITRFDFGVAAGVVSLACAGVAVVLLYRMLVRTGDRFVALGSVLCLCTYPGAPILQVGYSEGLALLLIVVSVTNLRERRYGWVAVGMVLLSLTRPVVLPFAIVVGVHWLVRWRRARVDPFPLSERVSVVGVALTAVLSTVIWPVVAAVATGDADAFSKTQSAWPANQGSRGLWANWVVTTATERSVGLLVAILLMLAVIGYAVSRPAARNWGLELRTWSLAYPAYLLIATRPGPSILRYLLLAVGPLWPLPETPSARESPTQRRMRWAFLVAIALVGTVGQYFWVTRVFTISQSPELQPYP